MTDVINISSLHFKTIVYKYNLPYLRLNQPFGYRSVIIMMKEAADRMYLKGEISKPEPACINIHNRL